MRRCAERKVFEIVMTNDNSGVLQTDAHAGHSCIAIGVSEIAVSVDEDVLIIRTTRREDKEPKEDKLDDGSCAPDHKAELNRK